MSMSQLYANEDRADIGSNKEIFSLFIIFALILYFIYPDKILKKQALKEKSNYALASLYLENMLRLDSSNVELLFAAVTANLGEGRLDLAKKLMGVLEKATGGKKRARVNLLQYKLYILEKQRDEKRSKQIEQKMKKLLNKVAKRGEFGEKYAFVWYKYALALSQKEDALSFLKPLYKRGDPNALEQCVYLSTDLNRTKEKSYCTKRLINLDDNRSAKWLEVAYIMYMQSEEYPQAISILKKLVKLDKSYNDELARVELMQEHFQVSADIFMQLYKKSPNKEMGKKYLMKAIQSLLDGKMVDSAVALIKKNEDKYLQDDAMMEQFLKYYLAFDRVAMARELSLKLLKEGHFE